MNSSFNCKIQDIYVGIGPSIRKCCQKTKDTQFYSQLPEWKNYYYEDNEGTGHTDLVGFSVNEMKQMGIRSNQIEAVDFCTNDNKDKFFTHKQTSPELPEGRFATFICQTSK